MALLLLVAACKKFVEIGPPDNQITSDIVFSSDASADNAINGIYSEMNNNSDQFSDGRVTLMAGLAADELYYYFPGAEDEFYSNQITIANHQNLTNWFWYPAYKYIYTCNLSIEKLNASNQLSAGVKKRLIAESKFLRAFCYFHLVNIFGDAPLVQGSDYNQNAVIPRAQVEALYTQMQSDLGEAIADLPENYLTAERARANKFTAMALLAKIYLYQENWSMAENLANGIIDSRVYELENDLNNVFLTGSHESIWQLSSVQASVNTWEGNHLLPASDLSAPAYLLRPELLNDFEPGDLRKQNWVAAREFDGDTVYYPFKYKVYGNYAPITESYVILRLADLYLIRAEARAQQGNLQDALDDLNRVRSRAGLTEITGLSQPDLVNIIYHERRIEFFCEFGNRWYDLKRTGRADAVLGSLKPDTWQSTDVLWPIPQNQINQNPALKQNPGY